MPKLSPIQWLVFVVFLAFYGFAVFALTRDHYLRNPAPVVAASPATRSPHGLPKPQQPRTWIQDAMQPGGGAVPAVVTETNPVLLNQNADQLFSQKRYGAAIPLYRRVIELDPADVDAYNDLGLALHYSGQTDAGLDMLRAGTAKDPGFQRIWLTLGFVSSQSGDAAGARTALEKARELDPDNSIGQEAARMLGLIKSEQP
jgi:tetratricopeptide (TPR) repeat protein